MDQNDVFFYFLKITFDISTHQNDLKILKKLIESKIKIKKFYFFLKFLKYKNE
jgi:hypothetical protein